MIFCEFFPLSRFWPKIDEHDLRLTSITSDLIWLNIYFFRECEKLMFGQVLKTARQNSLPFLGYLRKTTCGPFAPPSGRGLMEVGSLDLGWWPGLRWPGAKNCRVLAKTSWKHVCQKQLRCVLPFSWYSRKTGVGRLNASSPPGAY